MKIFYLTFFYLIIFKFSFAQKITYNHIVDTSNIEVKKVKTVFENYINSRPDSIYSNPNWCESEKDTKSHFDILYGEFQPSLYMGFPIHVLSIVKIDSQFILKVMFLKCSNEGVPFVLCIVNYYVVKEGNYYKLSNALYHNRKKWQKTKIGLITFYYPFYHKFDTLNALKLNEFSKDLCENLNIIAKEYEYYFADDFVEIQNLKGFDYWLGMGGNTKPTGIAGNGRVFCSGLNESYLHEPFHILTNNSKFKAHLWASEGVATFVGGSRGKSLYWHLCKLNKFLIEHKYINLSDTLLEMKTLDEYTDFRYAIGGIIAKRIFEKQSWQGISRLLSAGYTDQDYFSVIEEILGVNKNYLNKYLREEIMKECEVKY